MIKNIRKNGYKNVILTFLITYFCLYEGSNTQPFGHGHSNSNSTTSTEVGWDLGVYLSSRSSQFDKYNLTFTPKN